MIEVKGTIDLTITIKDIEIQDIRVENLNIKDKDLKAAVIKALERKFTVYRETFSKNYDIEGNWIGEGERPKRRKGLQL